MSETNVIKSETISNTNNTAVAPVSKQQTVKETLEKYKDQIAQALPTHIRADHFIRTALTCINKTPKLLDCTLPSLMGALLTSAQLGLNPDGVLGEAYLIPFNNNKKQADGSWKSSMEVQFIPGYRGLVQLALRSGVVSSFQAREVYENDEFEYEFGLDPRLKHIPLMEGDRGALKFVYAVCKFTNGGTAFEVMNMNEVEMIRMKSKAPNSPAWKEFYPEMAKKTVIRKLSKMCPLSPEFNKAVGLDETAEFLGTQKNDREVMNYNFDQSIKNEVEEAIHEDIVAEETEQAEAKVEVKADKTNAAVQQTLEQMKAKETPAPVEVSKEEAKESPVVKNAKNLYAEYSERISASDSVGDLNYLKIEIEKDENVGLRDSEDLIKLIAARVKKLGGKK